MVSVFVFAGSQYAEKRWERLSKQAETLADNVVSRECKLNCVKFSFVVLE